MGVSIWEGSKAQALIDAINNTQKVDKQQGEENAGKVLTVGGDGIVTPMNSTISTDVKNALLTCFRHVAWIDENGQDFYDALEAAMSGTPVPTYSHTLRYKASNGVILSQTEGFEVAGGSLEGLEETITNNILNITLPATATNYKMIRLADYDYASFSKARIACRYRINAITRNRDESGLALSIKAGTSCAGLFMHYPQTGSTIYFATRDSGNVVHDNVKTITLGTWYDVELLIDNGVQTIKVDGDTIYTGAGHTYLKSSGFLFTKTQGEGVLDVDIDNAVFQWN